MAPQSFSTTPAPYVPLAKPAQRFNQGSVPDAEKDFWLDLRRCHVQAAEAIARRLGLDSCSECGHSRKNVLK